MKMMKHKKLTLLITVLMLLYTSIPTVLAGISISTDRSTYLRGDTVTITVSGGTADGVAMVQVDGPSAKLLADQDNFDGSGGLTYVFKLPSDAAYGSYKIWVRDDGAGVRVSKYVKVASSYSTPMIIPNTLPIAVAGADRSALVGRSVYFGGSGSIDPDGDIISYVWNFGDGSTKSGARVSHAYSAAGTYTVTLTVKDDRLATSADTLFVTVEELPLEPESGVDEGVEGDEEDQVVDAVSEADTEVTLSTTDEVTVTVVKYPSNPYPDIPLPEGSIPPVVDIFVSNPDAISWPIYVKRYYTDAQVTGLNESNLAFFYYMDGAWHRCRNTGVDVDENFVWANMYEDEVTGSPTMIAPILAAASFQVSDLTVTPSEVEPGDDVTVSVLVTNVGEGSGDYAVTLTIDSVEEDTETVTLTGGANASVSFTVSKMAEATYSVDVNGLTSSFTVETPEEPEPPEPAEFEISDLSVTPSEIDAGDDVSVSMTVSNVGEESGSHTIEVEVDGVLVDSGTVTLDGGASTTVSFTVTSSIVGSHAVAVDGLSGSFSVRAPPEPPEPAEFEISDLTVSPSTVEADETVTVSVVVSNVGEESGGIGVELELDGAVVDTKAVTLDGGASSTVSFSVSSDEVGSHTVEVGGLSGSFTVEKAKAGFPWTYVIVALVLIAAVAYYLYSQRQ
jgi:hypothetical protein